jgi:type I restriction enzyme R subunit
VIAAELVTQVRKSVTIDWTLRAVTDAQQRPGFQSARAKIKVLVKRIEIRSLPALAHCFPRSFTFYVAPPGRSILRKHGYPPDLEEEATKTVLAQAELLCSEWTN